MGNIPRRFRQHIRQVHGQEGADWLDELPRLLKTLSQSWEITIAEPFRNLSYNYVAPAILRDGTQAVLKVGLTDDGLLRELLALEAAQGPGYVRLLRSDRDKGAMLLERLDPGRPLLELDDDEEATRIAATVMKRIWRPPPEGHSFPRVEDWASGLSRLRAEFNGGTGPFPQHLVEQAESLFSELLSTMAEPVLLHGDLHHDNILSAQREPWLAIDPKGVVGEPAYEVGSLMRNPMPRILEMKPAQLERRLDILSEELGFDRRRLRDWSFAQAVLSAWWGYEDHGPDRVQYWLPYAELLAQLK
jgi:streptomycin 6-kinase